MIFSSFEDRDWTDGLGSDQSIARIVGTGGQLAAGVVPGVLAGAAASSAAAGGSGLILGLAPALAVPVIGAAIAGITLAVSLFLNRNSKYHAQETATTKIVDDAEVLMKQNLAAWYASDKYQSEQVQALDNFNQIWGQVVQACSNPAYDDPGRRCVSDRQRGGQWDWFSYFYDPIANDPGVKADPVAPGAGGTNIVDTSGSLVTNLGNTVSDLVSKPSVLIPALLLGGIGIVLFGLGGGGD